MILALLLGSCGGPPDDCRKKRCPKGETCQYIGPSAGWACDEPWPERPPAGG